MSPVDAVGATVGPVDVTTAPRYGGDTTFARLPRLQDVPDADVLVWGVPFDSGVSYRPGARFGPNHIRQGSRLLRPYNPGNGAYPFDRNQVADAGDLGVNPYDIWDAVDTIQSAATDLTATGRTLLTLGGDHTIALPLLRVQHSMHGPLAVVHFDAHLDTWEAPCGVPYTHGNPFRRAFEDGLVDTAHSIHIGLRGPLYAQLDLDESERMGFAAVHFRDFARLPLDGLITRIRDRVGDRPVYVSIDIDVLDPAYAPGTGTPEAGGLSSRELLEMIRGMADLAIVGMDVVEVSPPYDHAELTAIAAAHVGYELLSVLPARR
ncbi:agmatinase [Nocardia carnea]|uniref:agmatinase n=1 Tax=Nocardia carnea TaxID=37328 RepID=UPI003D7B84F1